MCGARDGAGRVREGQAGDLTRPAIPDTQVIEQLAERHLALAVDHVVRAVLPGTTSALSLASEPATTTVQPRSRAAAIIATAASRIRERHIFER